MTRPTYEPARVRQLRILLWVVLVVGAVLAVLALGYLLGGSDPVLVLLVVVAPAVLMLGLGSKTLQLLGRGQPSARSWVIGTGCVVVLTGLLLSRTGPGLLLAVVGILLLLGGVLPARDADPGPTSDG